MLNPASAPVQINTTASQIEFPITTFAMAGGMTGVVYISTPDPNTSSTTAFLRSFDATGALVGSEVPISLPTAPAGYEVDNDTLTFVQLTNGNIAAFYSSFITNPPQNPPPNQIYSQSFMQVYQSTGAALGAPTQVGTNNNTIQDAVIDGSGIQLLISGNTPGIMSYTAAGVLAGFSTLPVSPTGPGLTGFVEQMVTASNGIRAFGITNFGAGARVDFEGASPAIVLPTIVTSPTLGVSNQVTHLLAGPAGSVIAVVMEYQAVIPAGGGNPTSVSESAKIFKVTDGNPTPTLLATIPGAQNVPYGYEGGIWVNDAKVLIDGSVVLAYEFNVPNGLPDATLVRINATGGIQDTVNLGLGGFDGASHLTVLADQSVVVTFGAAPSGGALSQFEVYTQRFITGATAPVISTTPTAGDDSLTGTTGIDNLNALGGNDTIIALAGNDVLEGGTGADSMVGSAGDDIYYADNAGDVVVELAGEGADLVYASAFNGSLANVETVIAYGSGAFTATGDNGVNLISAATLARFAGVNYSGLGGNDVFYGSNYADTLDGGADNDILIGYSSVGGVDSLTGGAGDDSYYVLEADDVIVELAGGGYDTVYAQASITLSANVEQVVVSDAATQAIGNAEDNNIFGLNSGNNLRLEGLGGEDWLVGSNFNDYLLGGTENDVLQGLIGNNRLEGGAGDDVYVSASAADVIVENAGEGFDTVFASVSMTALAANVEQLVAYGAATVANGNDEMNTIYGNNSSNALSIDAGAGNDLVYGSTLADTLIGGLGNDAFLGLGGADRYTYNAAGNMGADVIYDFNDGTCLIDLTGRGYTAGSLGGAITIGGGANALVTFASGSLAGTTITIVSVNQVGITTADFVF